jgi:hypothetical protein
MKTKPFFSMIQAGALALTATSLLAGDPPPPSTSANRLPVRSVTVFKDGHAFVAQEGAAAIDASGDVLLDQLPSPVLGTFWTYSANTNARVTSVTAGQRITSIERTAMNLREMIAANPNSSVVIEETNQRRFDATIVGFLARSSEELAATSIPGTPPQPRQISDQILIKTEAGTSILPVDRIASVIFKNPPSQKTSQEELRPFLRLHVDGAPPGASGQANIGMTYLQKGIRWIPSYEIDIDGNSNAVVKLQATVINEMIDLTDVTLNLVVGVPSFAAKDSLDPIAIQQTAAQLSQFFQSQQSPIQRADNNRMNLANNAIMSQVVMPQQMPEAPESTSYTPAEGAKNEDLYVFTLNHITLKRNERIVLPISVQTLPYHDVFTLTIPVAPPSEMGRNLGSAQQQEMFRLLNSPKVKHKIRLANTSAAPLTTAPALVLKNGKLISQGLMTYAAPGAGSDITLTDAIDIPVKKTDVESSRTPDGLVLNGTHYFRIDLKGKLHLTNRRNQPTEIEVKRYVLGQPDSCNHDGQKSFVNWFESRDTIAADVDPAVLWWNYYSFPWWWSDANGAGQLQWNVKLDKGESIDLEYAWHYFWL